MSWHASFRLSQGELSLDISMQGDETPVAIIGPNGSGKSTLLRVFAGALSPDAGSLSVNGHPYFDSDQHLDLPPEKRSVGYLPQGYGLFPHLNVFKNVAFSLKANAPLLSPAEQEARVHTTLREMDCLSLAERFPHSLSGGEAQRVALARALIMKPRILLLDEPLAALDATSRREMRHYIAEQIKEQGIPTLMVTHDRRDIEAVGTRVVALEDGRIIQDGTAQDIMRQPASDFIAEFFDVPLDNA